MSPRRDDSGSLHRQSAQERLTSDPIRPSFDHEALESFAEVLGILREWVEDEQKRTTSGATDDGTSACSVC